MSKTLQILSNRLSLYMYSLYNFKEYKEYFSTTFSREFLYSKISQKFTKE